MQSELTPSTPQMNHSSSLESWSLCLFVTNRALCLEFSPIFISNFESQVIAHFHIEGHVECGILALWWQVGNIFLPDLESRTRVLQVLADRIPPKRAAIVPMGQQGLSNVLRNLDTELASSYPILGNNLSDDSVTLAHVEPTTQRQARLRPGFELRNQRVIEDTNLLYHST
jgi:hypothetical protein